MAPSTGPETTRETAATASSTSAGSPPGRQSKTRWGARGSPSASVSSQPAWLTRAAATKTPGRPCPRRPRERHALDGCEAFVVGRRLELAKRAHLLGRREQARFRSRRLLQLVRERKRPEAIEQALDEVDLRLCERRVEPEAAGRDAVARRRLHDVAARRAGEVGVVEDDLARPRRERLVERVGDAPRASRRARLD